MGIKTKNPLKKNQQKMRRIDQFVDEIDPWWKKTYVYIEKKEVSSLKGSLILMFVAGAAAALIWSAKLGLYRTINAAPASAIYFSPATATTTIGSSVALTANINPGTNHVNAATVHIKYDGTKLNLTTATPSPTFSTILSASTGNPSGLTITNGSTSNATAAIDLAVPNGSASITSSTAVVTFNFTTLATVINSSVSFDVTTGAAADGESSNVVTTMTGATVTVNPLDATAPSGGSINYTNGYATSASVALTANDGTDSETGINTSSRIIQRKSATLSNGTCGAHGTWSTISPTGTYPNFTDSTVLSGNCYQYQYLVSDNAATPNQSTYTTSNVIKIDTSAPVTGSVTYSDGYFQSTSVSLTASDGTDSISGLNISSRIVQRKSATLSNGTCGAYGAWSTISPTGTFPNYTDSTVLSGNCYQYQYMISDNAGNQAKYTSTNTAKVETATPSGGYLNITGGYYKTLSIALSANDGSDAISGINTSSRIVQRQSATLSNGTCGTYGAWSTISPTGTYPNFTDSTVLNGNCYQYRYQISNNAGLQATYSVSSAAKVDSAAPSSGSASYTDGFNSTHSIIFAVNDGSDVISGINTASRVIQRKIATMTAGNCGSFGSWVTITPTGSYPNFIDSTIATGNCYQYQYLVSDNATNQATYSSPNQVKGSYPADISLNGAVDIYDYSIMHTNWSNASCGNIADINGNCLVDIFDYSLLHTDYGKSV